MWKPITLEEKLSFIIPSKTIAVSWPVLCSLLTASCLFLKQIHAWKTGKRKDPVTSGYYPYPWSLTEQIHGPIHSSTVRHSVIQRILTASWANSLVAGSPWGPTQVVSQVPATIWSHKTRWSDLVLAPLHPSRAWDKSPERLSQLSGQALSPWLWSRHSEPVSHPWKEEQQLFVLYI